MKKLGYASVCVAVACVGCEGRAVPRDVTSVERAMARAPHVTPDALPPEARAAYERDRVEVVPLPPPRYVSAEDRGRPLYKFSGAGGSLTENEFVRRYHKLSGDGGLDDVEHWRTPVVGAIAGFLGMSAVMTLYFANVAENGFDKGPEGGADGIAIVLGPVGVLLAGGLAVACVVGRDGGEGGHELTEDNAVTYARRYNQLLLLRAAGLTYAPLPPRARVFEPTVRAGVTPVGIGISGAF